MADEQDAHTFVNDVLKPWEELNELLVQRYAFQPDLSDVTRSAQGLASSLKHQVDAASFETGRSRRELQAEADAQPDLRLMSDVADTAKHRILWDAGRQASMHVAAMFEVNGQAFRFIRNRLVADHASLGTLDFLASSAKAIEYWISKRGLPVVWQGSIREAPCEYFPTAFLRYDSRYCFRMDSTRFQFYRKNSAGELLPYDPETVRIEIY